MTYIKQLDAFRFFGFFGVFITHLFRFEDPILARLPFGYGVNLFFVLSGFLITKLLLEARFNSTLPSKTIIKNFYIKRSIRIFPIYFGTMLFLHLIQFQNYKEVAAWVFTYTTNIYISLGLPYLGSYNHLWSLAVEEQFYLIWPFIILFIPQRFLLKGIYFILIASLLFKTMLFINKGVWSPGINASTISCMDAFGLGALIAYWNMFDKGFIKCLICNKTSILSVSLVFIIFLIYPTVPQFPYIGAIYSNFLFSVISFYLLLPATQDAYTGWFKKLIENKLIVHLGKISYGLYLYHFFMPDLYNYLISKGVFGEQNREMRFIICFILCLIIAELSWYIIEKPFNKLKKNYN